MTDTALIKKFKADPAAGYSALLDRYTPVLLRMIRQALKRFRINSELTPWLSVVVANACRDRFRKNRVTSVPNSVISKLDKVGQLVFRYYYQDRMNQSEIADAIQGKHEMACSSLDVARSIAVINDLLSVNKRWHLIAALRANRPVLSLDDSAADGAFPIVETLSFDLGKTDESEDQISQLNEAIKELDTEDQLLVLLRFEHGMRATQIAKIMQFENHKYVYTRLRTIMNRLRKHVGVAVEDA